MIDRNGKDIDFSELFMEETLTAKDKKNIPDDQWGLLIRNEKGEIIERKFPLNDERHVKQAAIMFNRAKGLSDDQKRELARNIVRRAKELNMDYSGWESLKPYLGKGKNVQEQYMTFEWLDKHFGPNDETTGTTDFDEKDDFSDESLNESHSLSDLLGPIITEAYDAVTGKEIPIEKAYTLEEMKDITFSNEEAIDAVEVNEKSPGFNKSVKVKPPKEDEVYFGAQKNFMPEIDVDSRPLFVTPYKGLASIFVGREDLHNRLRGMNYNLDYDEWGWDPKKLTNPLKVVHVRVEGVPELKPFVLESEGYIHCIKKKDYEDNFYRSGWMNNREWLIMNTDNMKVAFTRLIKCKVKYIVEGAPGKGNNNNAQIPIKNIVDAIANKTKADSKDPTGNQNCLLCTWCLEAQCRGIHALPRPIYSPRDPVFKTIPTNIVFDGKQISLKQGYDNMLEHLQDVEGSSRWYCHVTWDKSSGGHEFMIMARDDKKFHVVDAQAGIIEPLKNTHKYFKDINWEMSYICRLDNKRFNYKLLEVMNDPKMTLEWDPDVDIPYLEKGGMTPKEPKIDTKLFYRELKKALKETPVQESATSESLFSQLPKDLQEFLEKRDFSIVNEDYGIDGYGVEEFFKPEFIDTAGKSYDLKKDDKFYNAIDFATDGGGNDFVFLPSDGYYYSLDHEVYDENNHIHGDKLSSRKWYDLLDPNHKREFKDDERKEISIKYRNITDDSMYSIITKYALMDDLTSSDCNTFRMSYDYTLRKTDWILIVNDFASEYKCTYLKDVMAEFSNFMQKDFVKLFKYDKDGLKRICIKIVASFIKVKNQLDVDTSQCSSTVINRYKEFLEKFGPVSIQESAIGEILNGVNPFSNKRVFHISQDGHLDGQVFKPRVPEYLDKYDPSQDKFEDVENPRVCFSPSIEGCLNAIMVTIGRWKTAEKLREWYVYVPEKPLKEYKHRTNKQLVKEKKVYDANVTDEIWIEEPVRLKQYGIIRIDQVSSKSIKDTVPTTKGFTGHRYKYSFKWHWLVKPKVIADLPYDYSPKEVCKDMIADMEKYKYGLAENGKVHSASAHDYDTKYKLQSPEEFEQNGGGICYDYVEFMEGYLNAYGYDCKKYFISTETEDNTTHTFLLVGDGRGWKDGFIYPEASFKPLEGVYEVHNYEEAALKIMDKIFDIDHNSEKYDEIKYYVWEYSGHPPYGSDMKTCMEYFSKGEPIHEGTAMKIKRKD